MLLCFATNRSHPNNLYQLLIYYFITSLIYIHVHLLSLLFMLTSNLYLHSMYTHTLMQVQQKFALIYLL